MTIRLSVSEKKKGIKLLLNPLPYNEVTQREKGKGGLGKGVTDEKGKKRVVTIYFMNASVDRKEKKGKGPRGDCRF